MTDIELLSFWHNKEEYEAQFFELQEGWLTFNEVGGTRSKGSKGRFKENFFLFCTQSVIPVLCVIAYW